MRIFSVGPSCVVKDFWKYAQEAQKEGILSINHRSEAFHALYRRLREATHRHLLVPKDYAMICASAATECWEIIAQSLTKRHSLHLCKGDMAEKWHKIAKNQQKSLPPIHVSPQEETPADTLTAQLHKADLLAITHNETSNGSRVEDNILREISALCKKKEIIVALDATSSMGAMEIPWKYIDVCFASVQKCLGMPAGMALMFLSPYAQKKAQEIGDTQRYNSVIHSVRHFANDEAPYTPNVLAIYCLWRIMRTNAPIKDIIARIEAQARQWYDFLDAHERLFPFISSPSLRSPTILCVKSASATSKIYEALRKEGFWVSPGYGRHRESTLRIANFPSIDAEDICALKKFLSGLNISYLC